MSEEQRAQVEEPTAEMREIFGVSFSAAEHFAQMLAEEGELRGLVGPRELPRLWSRHIVNSAAVVPFLPARGSVADVGSGAAAIKTVLGSTITVWRDALTVPMPLSSFSGMTVLPWMTGLVCGNDRMAMGAYDAIREQGLRVREDVAVIGIDDQELIADQVHPALTTVALPFEEMGQVAVSHLLALMEGEEVPAETLLPGRIIRRSSA